MSSIKNPHKVGDVVSLARWLGTSGEGILWRVVRAGALTMTVEPIFSVTDSMGADGYVSLHGPREFPCNVADPVDVVTLGAAYVKLGNIIRDIIRAKS